MTQFEDDDDGGVAVAEPQVRVRPRTRKQPNYALIIENDDDHTFDYVVLIVSRVCGHSLEKALELTLLAHHDGEALIWSGSLEVAELKYEQIREFGPDPFASRPVNYPLGARIEPLVGE